MNGNNRDNGNGGGENRNWWAVGAVIAGAGALIGGAAYILTRASTANTSQSKRERESSFLTTLCDHLQGVTTSSNNTEEGSVSRSDVPLWPTVNNLNSLLQDILVRYVALKREDFSLHYRVFTRVFEDLHQNMKLVDKYYNRYSSNIQFAGSHYDHLRINKPDEFDLDIVIGLPVNMRIDPINPVESDIVMEQKYPGYVQLRGGVQYQKILVRDGEDCIINRTAHSWMDDKNYILRSKFTDWFKSVGVKALNRFRHIGSLPVCTIDGEDYTIRTSSSGPAWTIVIESFGFRLDVDLVPALKFSEVRWLGGNYRQIPTKCRRGYWMVVPKPNKAGLTFHDEQRSWRIAMQDQEKQLLHNTYNLRPALRLMKKFRDSRGMKKIASYYIKTIFFWEIVEKQHDPQYWQRNNIATILKHMVGKLYEALNDKNMPYFWNRNNNMIAGVPCSVLNDYKNKVKSFYDALDGTDYNLLAEHLLTYQEYHEYRRLLG